jgi:hypothetical protein
MTKSSRDADPFERPLDATLERLRAHGQDYRPHPHDLERWRATCPSCGNEMELRERHIGAAVEVVCGLGCDVSRIIDALAREPSRDSSLVLAEEAANLARRAIRLAEVRTCA